MCGINGLVLKKGVKRDNTMVAYLKFLFNELMVESQGRGEHATGIAHFKHNGKYDLYKRNISADKMVTTDKQYLKNINSIDNNTSVILSHTRYYTKGKPDNNLNNHPFDIGNIVGVHNGSVKNDDELFKAYGFNRMGEVDSEIIFHLINLYNSEKVTRLGLRVALENSGIQGLFALAFVNKNQPQLIHLVKQDKPMSIASWQEAGVLIFNSDSNYIKKAFNRLKRTIKQFNLKHVGLTVDYYKVRDNTYFTIDATAKKYKDMISTPDSIYIQLPKPTYGYGYGYGTLYNGNNGILHNNNDNNNMGLSTKKTVTKNITKKTVEGELSETTGELIAYY